MPSIQIYQSSFSNRTSYFIRKTDERRSDESSGSIYLKKTVLKFKWIMEKNGIYWFNGLRKLQPTPYKYTIPPLHFLKGTVAPKRFIRYEQPFRREAKPVPILTNAGKLF